MLWLLAHAWGVEPMLGMTVGMTTRAERSPFGRVYVGVDASLGLLRQRSATHLTGGPLAEARLSWLGRPSLALGAMGSVRSTHCGLRTGGDVEASYVFERQRSGVRLGIRGHGLLQQNRIALDLARRPSVSFAVGNAVDSSVFGPYGCYDYKLSAK